MTHPMSKLTRYRRSRLVAASSAAAIVWAVASAAHAQDLPTNPVIVDSNGVGTAADFTFGSNSLTIDQHHDRVVINWDDFNIGTADTVTFNQPTENAIAFNRVDPSAFTTIDGTLNANGGVWLFSPGGLLFGANATVNVGSFVGSTATLANADVADALATNAITLTPGGAPGSLTVSNGAQIGANTGFVVLLGETIVQNGQIVSDQDAVWYGVAQGGEVTFTPGAGTGDGPNLTDGTVAAVAGQQPAFTQGSTGSTTAATWVGVSNPATTASGWSTLINLGGTIEASGVKPTTDSGVWIITGDDGVYDLTTPGTVIDATGLITSNNGDVFLRTGGEATLQDVYAEDIDVFTGGDLTLTGAIQATGDIIIGSDTLISIESTADLGAGIDVIITTTAAGGDIEVDGSIYAYQYATLVAHDQLTVDGAIEGLYGVDLQGDDVTTAAGSSVTSFNNIYVNALNTADLSGDMAANNVTVAALDIVQRDGTITVESGGLYFYAYNDITTEAGALIEAGPDADHAVIYLNAGHDLYLGGDIQGDYFVTINSIGIGGDTTLEVSGSIYASDFILLYNDDGDIHLTGTANLYTGAPIEWTYPSIYIAAEGSIQIDAGASISTTGGYAGEYIGIYSNDVTGTIEVAGDLFSETVNILANYGDVDIDISGGSIDADDVFIEASGDLNVAAVVTSDYVYLSAGGDLTIANDITTDDIYIDVGGDLTQSAGVIDTTNDFTVDTTGAVTLGGTVYANNITVDADGDVSVTGELDANGHIDLYSSGGDVYAPGRLEAETYINITGDAVTLGEVSGDNLAIDVLAESGITLNDDLWATPYSDITLETTGAGSQIDIAATIYASTITAVSDGDITLQSTADVNVRTYVNAGPGDTSASFTAYGDLTLVAGSELDAREHLELTTTGTAGVLTVDGFVRGANIDIQAGGDISLGGDISASDLFSNLGDVTVESTGAGAVIDIDATIYAYEVDIQASGGDINLLGGTITVDDGGAYLYAYNDLTTSAGSLIEAAPDGGNAIIYLNAGDDLTVGGDIHGGYFVNLNSEANDLDSTVTISGDIYATDFIIVYNQYGDIHLTGTADLYAGAPISFSEPGIWIAAEGSILSDAGSTIGTMAGYADGYVHIESNATDGSIDLSSDITSENVTIEAPFGVVDIYLRGGTIQTANDFYIDSNGLLLVGANIYADYVTLESVGDMTITGDIVAINSVSATSTGGDVYVSGYIYGYAEGGTAILVSAEGDLTIAAGGDLETYGDVVLQTTGPDGVLEVSGDVMGNDVYLVAQGDILVGSTADIYAYDDLELLSDGPDGTAANIEINGWINGNGVSIINRNDGDVILGATAHVASYYYQCTSCRIEPGEATALLGADGDIYIYSTGAVTTAAGSVIDATLGYGADAGLLTIVANGADGATAAIDLSGSIVADDTVLTASAGSIALRSGATVEYGAFTADAAQDFTLESGASIEAFAASDVIDITAGDDITLDGLVDGSWLHVTATGDANDPNGAVIDIGGTVRADYYVGIENQAGDIFIRDGAYVGGAYYTGYTVVIDAHGDLTTEAGSYIYGASIRLLATAQYGDLTTAGDIYGEEVYLFADTNMDVGGTISGQTVDIVAQGGDSAAGDITISAAIGATGGIRVQNYNDGVVTVTEDASLVVTFQGEVCVTCSTGGETALQGNDGDVYIYSAGEVVTEAGSLIESTGLFGADAGLLTIVANDGITLGGDIDAGVVRAMIYSGAGTDGAEIRIDGLIEASDNIYIANQVGDVVLGATGELYGNTANTINQPDPAIEIRGERIVTEDGSMIRTPTHGEVYLAASAASGVTLDLGGDADVGIFYARNVLDGDIVISGDINAADDIQINSNGALTLDAGAALQADDLVQLRSDRDMLLAGDIYAGNYFIASIYGGESGGADESLIRVEGDIGAGYTIRIYNDVGDVEIGAGATLNGNMAGDAYGGLGDGYQTYTIEITGENITTEAGSLITVGAVGGPRLGSVYLHAVDYTYPAFGDPTLVDLSGDINTETLVFNIENGALRVRDGDIEAINSLSVQVDGYIIVDDPATIFTHGDLSLLSYGGMTIEGDLTSDRMLLIDDSANDLVIGGFLAAEEDITIHSLQDDVRIDQGATLIADTDGVTGGQDYNGIAITAEGQLTTASGSLMRVGPQGAPTGDVSLVAHGNDGNGFASLDIASHIEADALYLYTEAGSVRIRYGQIQLDDDLDIDSQGSFLMDGQAQITTDGSVTINAETSIGVVGTIDAGGDIFIANAGAGGGVTVNGYLYADEAITIANNDADAALILGGPTIIADADGVGPGGSLLIDSAGTISAPGGGLLQVGSDPDAPTGLIIISALGSDVAGQAALDLAIDINAAALDIDVPYGSIQFTSGDIHVLNDLTIASEVDLVVGDHANIEGEGNIHLGALNSLVLDGDVTAGGDITLMVGGSGLLTGFTADLGDMTISGSVTANGSVIVGNSGGDIYLDGTASVVANADDTGTTDEVYLYTDNQIVTADGSSIQVGTGAVASGNVTLRADGADNADYSAIDLSGDINAQSLILRAYDGSIHLAGGDITVSQGFLVNTNYDFVMDDGATLASGGHVSVYTDGALTVNGDIDAQGDLWLQINYGSGDDMTVGGLLTAGGDLTLQNNGGGSLTIEDTAVLDAGDDVSVTSGANVLIYGDIYAGGDVSLILNQAQGHGYFTAGPNDLVISGTVEAGASVTIDNAEGGDIYLDATADVTANADDNGLTDEVYITADGQVISAAGSSIAVGTGTVGSGDVTILAGGLNAGGYTAIDLAGDIIADDLTLQTSAGSIRLRDGEIDAAGAVNITSAVGFLMNDLADIDAQGDVSVIAQVTLTANGDIDSGGSILLRGNGVGGSGPVVVGGTITADQDVTILNFGTGDIYLPYADIVADADVTGDGSILVQSSGQVIGTGSTLTVGDADTATGGIRILAGGPESANFAAVDLDIDTYSTYLQVFAFDNVRLRGGEFVATGDIDVDSHSSVYVDAGVTLDGGGTVWLDAGDLMVMDGDIYAGGDIHLEIYVGEGLLTQFTPDGGDIVVSGNMTANGSVVIAAPYFGGDVYLDGTATIVADADSSATGEGVNITADGQVISAAGSSILVGATGAPTGDVFIEAQGADNANYSSVDLNSDIEAVNLTVDSDGGSVNLAGGLIETTGNVQVESVQDVIMDEPANIYAGGDIYFDAEQVMTVEGSLHADGGVYLLVDGPNAQTLTVDRLVAAGGDITIRNTGGDIVLGSQTALFSGDDITLEAAGDLSTDGFIDAADFFSAESGADMTIASDIQAGGGILFNGDEDTVLNAVIIAENTSNITVYESDTFTQSGSLIAGGHISIESYGEMDINGTITAGGTVGLLVDGSVNGADLTVSGDVTANGNVSVANFASYGDVVLTGTGSLTADANGDGGATAELFIRSSGQVISHDGSTMHVGSPTSRTGWLTVYAYGYGGEGGAAIDVSGDLDAERIELYASDGSVAIRDTATVGADESIEIFAYEDFILEDGGVIWGAQERQFQDDISTETTLPGLAPGVLISASDVDISGDVQSGDADDDATIVIAALNVDGDVTVGGADNGLSTGFTLSDAEFDNLQADRIVVLAGYGGESSYDLHIADLSIDAANTSDVWFGSSGTIFVDGEVAPSQAGEVDLHLGFTVLAQSHVIDLAPGEFLVDFVPTDIRISGSLGTVSNPFGHVTLVAHGDIFMGSSAFMDAAENDPEFDAFDESENFDSPGEGHVFIAADILQMAATGRILQQDTVAGTGFGGLVLGQPQHGLELIFSPDDIEGEPIDGGAWTANFNAGPTRIELFGQFNGTPHAITGRDAATVAHLLDPDILLGDYYINTCLFGDISQCRVGSDQPPFIDPTPPVHEPGVDDPLLPPAESVDSFFAAFPFSEPDEEDEEEQVEGEPVTGSGNEDLWPVRPLGGTR